MRSGVTKPPAIARPASSSSLATTMSMSPTPGVSASTGRLPPSSRARHGKDLDVIGGGAGALRDAGDRGRLHREAAASAAAPTIQSVSTPPPSPPSAAIRMVMAGFCHSGTARGPSRIQAADCAASDSGSFACWRPGMTSRTAQASRSPSGARDAACDPTRSHCARSRRDRTTGTARRHARPRRTGRSRRSSRSRSRPDRCAADRGLGFTVSDGQPESRMQEWSPVQISSSTPKRARTTRSPRLSLSASSARTRRWRASWHSPSAMMTLRPRSAVLHRLLQRLHHLGDAVGAHRAQPFDAERAQRLLDVHAGRGAVAVRARSTACIAGRSRRCSRSASRSARRRLC